MAKKVLILLGTKKGAFILESDQSRRSWGLRGPFCETWPLNHVITDPASGRIYGGGGDLWFGPAIWQSPDLGATWTHSSEGLAYPAEEIPTHSWLSSLGWGTRECRISPAPPGCQCGRVGWSRSPPTCRQDWPRSSLRNSPAGSTPA